MNTFNIQAFCKNSLILKILEMQITSAKGILGFLYG